MIFDDIFLLYEVRSYIFYRLVGLFTLVLDINFDLISLADPGKKKGLDRQTCGKKVILKKGFRSFILMYVTIKNNFKIPLRNITLFHMENR